MNLVVDTELPRAARWALEGLTHALVTREASVEVTAAPGSNPDFIIGLVSQSPAVDDALARTGVRCPDVPESLVLQPLASDGFLICGRDERGLIYALLEAACAVELAPLGVDVCAAIAPAIQSPHLAWRSMQLFLCNRRLEEAWFYDAEFWDEYLERLARCRYNNLSLTFGHQIAYLSPPYPFLLEVPEFPEVRPIGFTVEQCARHLDMLIRIAEWTRQRGLHFTFGVWSQHAQDYGDSMVEGLTPEIRAQYNAAGLARLLASCPGIDGVQFRMNYESGVAEDRQAEYYAPQFRAIAECGRSIRLDLRAKGLTDDTIELAQKLVPDTVISTKHWCEHLGMPYPMPTIQQFDQKNYRRYGTWDLLRKPRSFALIHRLWSAGSQRVLLWADPEWVRRFASSCTFGGDGFEVMAPLTNKGVRDEQPLWSASADLAFRSHAEEHRRHWMFYLLFGRLGYDPDASSEVWQRELHQRFGTAAASVEELYRVGGQILPLLTVVLQHSASLWTFWPERFAGRSLVEDAQVEPSDPTRFYGIDEYVEDALGNRLCGKWTPPQVAHHLHQLATQVRGLLTDLGGDSTGPELRHTLLDFTLLAHLAEYHACRQLAAVHLAFHHRAGAVRRLSTVRQHLLQARDHWSALSVAAEGAYCDDLVFGFREKGHVGHWKDDLVVVERDLVAIDALIAEQQEIPSADFGPFPGGDVHLDPPTVTFASPTCAMAGRDLELRIRCESPTPSAVRCYHRIAHQALDFDRVDMHSEGDGHRAVIPGDSIDPDWDLMVFFEFLFDAGRATRWPDWRIQTPY
ncbi:MAG: hypothetical protein F4Z30_01350, partial [Gemmatimonadetes bacterium]|nr:hypothetical protein [Gemmatimonadota bacterium]